mgnify:CR=1 FL=1
MKFLIAFLFSISLFSQKTVFENERTNILIEDNNYIITFDDENDDPYYYSEEYFIPKGKLALTENEFKLFVKNISKVMKKSEGNYRSEQYDLDKFSFINDTVFLWVNAKIGSFSKDDLKKIRKL